MEAIEPDSSTILKSSVEVVSPSRDLEDSAYSSREYTEKEHNKPVRATSVDYDIISEAQVSQPNQDPQAPTSAVEMSSKISASDDYSCVQHKISAPLQLQTKNLLADMKMDQDYIPIEEVNPQAALTTQSLPQRKATTLETSSESAHQLDADAQLWMLHQPVTRQFSNKQKKPKPLPRLPTLSKTMLSPRQPSPQDIYLYDALPGDSKMSNELVYINLDFTRDSLRERSLHIPPPVPPRLYVNADTDNEESSGRDQMFRIQFQDPGADSQLYDPYASYTSTSNQQRVIKSSSPIQSQTLLVSTPTVKQQKRALSYKEEKISTCK